MARCGENKLIQLFVGIPTRVVAEYTSCIDSSGMQDAQSASFTLDTVQESSTRKGFGLEDAKEPDEWLTRNAKDQ